MESKPTMSDSQYNQQYCEKHNQYYGDHLHRCPICWGEQMGEELVITTIDYTNLSDEEFKKAMEDKGV